MEWTEHGGECCGIRHIHGMSANEITVRRELPRILREAQPAGNSNRLVEIVLTDAQIAGYPFYPGLLRELGFRLVSRFRNSNSGRICNVFHHVPIPEDLNAHGFNENVQYVTLTVQHVVERQAPPPPAPEPRVVFTYYRRIYSDGREGDNLFRTYEQALAGHTGRGRRVDRYQVYASGAVRRFENVTE